MVGGGVVGGGDQVQLLAGRRRASLKLVWVGKAAGDPGETSTRMKERVTTDPSEACLLAMTVW